ncbi:MAG: dUTP pyrophosphatase [Myxococcota bacterium]
MSGRVLTVAVELLPHGSEFGLPAYQTAGSAGCDLHAAIEHPLTLAPGERELVPCGLRMALPPGWVGDIRPRSGLALRHGVTILNAPGTIDSDYRGELKVLLANHGDAPFEVRRGERIAQLVVLPVGRIEWQETGALDATKRSAGGFGSTGR